MEKLLKIEYIDTEKEFDADYYLDPKFINEESEINNLIVWLTDLKANGATHIKWRGYSSEGESISVEAQGIRIREETNEEFNMRMLEIEKRQKKQEENEKELYEKLRKKYENK